MSKVKRQLFIGRLLCAEVVVPEWVRRDSATRRRVGLPLAMILLAAAMWTVGLLGAWHDGFAAEYVSSPVGYVAGAGGGWSLYWYLWAVREVPKMFEGAGIAFSQQRAARKFAEVSRRWLEGFLIAPPAIAIVSVSAYVVIRSHVSHDLSGFPRLSGTQWASGSDLWLKNLVVILWAIPTAGAITAAGCLAVRYSILVFRLGRLRGRGALVESLPVLREAFRRAGRFGWVGGAAWNCGVIVIGVLVATSHYKWAVDSGIVQAAALVLVLSLFGVIGMVWPEIVLHRTLADTRARMMDKVAEKFRSSRGADREVVDQDASRLRAEPVSLHAWGGAFAVVGQIVVPVGIFLLTILLRSPAP